MASRYSEVYDGWRRDPEGFWREAAKAIDWVKAPDMIFDPKAGVYGRWFPDGKLNTCHNALDRHVERGRAIARQKKTEHIIHKKDGSIGRKNSYGNDPNPPKDAK